jgi:hypothetical protein
MRSGHLHYRGHARPPTRRPAPPRSKPMYLLKRLLPLTLAVPLILVSGTASPEASPSGTQTERIYLSGQGPGDAVPWDFYCSSGRKSGAWTTIPVPSNWEQEGFGGYNYGHDDPDTKHAEVGTYRTRFFRSPGMGGETRAPRF